MELVVSILAYKHRIPFLNCFTSSGHFCLIIALFIELYMMLASVSLICFNELKPQTKNDIYSVGPADKLIPQVKIISSSFQA